jgi:hypothetical protein
MATKAVVGRGLRSGGAYALAAALPRRLRERLFAMGVKGYGVAQERAHEGE